MNIFGSLTPMYSLPSTLGIVISKFQFFFNLFSKFGYVPVNFKVLVKSQVLKHKNTNIFRSTGAIFEISTDLKPIYSLPSILGVGISKLKKIDLMK
jgi:hypothetical protein